MRASEAGSRSGEAPLQIGFYTRRWDPQVPVLREICYLGWRLCDACPCGEKGHKHHVAGLRSRTGKAMGVPSKLHEPCAIRRGLLEQVSHNFSMMRIVVAIPLCCAWLAGNEAFAPVHQNVDT